MRKLLMIASVAALAVSMPAVAGDKGGNGKGGGKPEAHKVERGGGGGGNFGKEREKWAEQRVKEREKGFEQERKFAEQRHKEREKLFEERGKDREKRFERQVKEREKWAERRDKAFEKRNEAQRKWAEREQEARFRDRDDFRRSGYNERDYREGRRYAAFGDACPPGLAKKGNGCLPPGQAKKSYALGEQLPLAYYPSYNVPLEYRDWYWDSPHQSYRYDDGYIYRVDNDTGIIGALIPLLGGGFSVGNLLPSGYDVYNVPYQYRDQYYDTPESYYRYGDDAIYRVDPQSQMIEAVVALLAGDLNVGQMLPAGYDTYNLPLDYRDQYVDNNDSWYRYADGNIYEVDPQTRMIEAIVASLV